MKNEKVAIQVQSIPFLLPPSWLDLSKQLHSTDTTVAFKWFKPEPSHYFNMQRFKVNKIS